MNNLPSADIIRIFIRNRVASGWSHKRVATALRHRLRLADRNPAVLDTEQRARLDAIMALIATLEQSQS